MNKGYILYKLTTRSRPQRFLQTYESIKKHANNLNHLILVSIDDDDLSMHKFFENNPIDDPNMVVISGTSKNKIDAINRDVEKADDYFDWDILVNISDDMLITSDRFEVVLRESFKDDLDHFLHLPDGFANERIPTMSIMGRDYYNRFGYIYHPSYVSVWADNEAMDVAKLLGKWQYVNEVLFTHEHPANVGSHLMDEQYERTESFELHKADNECFENRKKNRFNLVELQVDGFLGYSTSVNQK